MSELSEGGARIVGADLAEPDREFAAESCFQDGEQVPIEGVVLRQAESETIVRFSNGIARKRMIAEQMRLSKKYPMLFARTKRE